MRSIGRGGVKISAGGRSDFCDGAARRRLEYAVELEELSANPLHKVRFRKAKVSGEVDRRSMVNPQQARELLTAVTCVGRSRGPMLAAMFACMYFGGLRPAEAAGLRQ